MASTLRSVQQVVQGQKTLEGAGVLVCRTLGTPSLKSLDPFLLLDELRLPDDQISAGFPSHPHRGFQTCTIMIEGRVEHKDSCGNHGVIGPGGVQWMTAGRGIVHSEMPKKSDTGRCWGFQLWINLPKADKMIKPRYQDYQAEDIPQYKTEGVCVRVLGGTSSNVTGPINMRRPGMLLDVVMQPKSTFHQSIPAEWNAMAYVSDGQGEISGQSVRAEQASVFGTGDHISARAAVDHPLRFLFMAGLPIGEPVVQHGSFVMNTTEEIHQAFRDFQSGKLQNPDDDVWAND